MGFGVWNTPGWQLEGSLGFDSFFLSVKMSISSSLLCRVLCLLVFRNLLCDELRHCLSQVNYQTRLM